MATIPSSPTWSNDVYQIDTMDAVLGGQDGVINVQAKQLADRTVYLKQEVEAAGAVADGAYTKADSALAQISGIEAAAGSAQANAAEALLHKQGAQAAQALAEQARNAAQAAQAQAGDNAGLAYQASQTAQLKAAEATSAATAAVAAMAPTVTAKDAAVVARNEAVAAVGTLADERARAETAAAGAEASEVAALAALNDFKGRWYGALASDPTTDPLGAPVNAGDAYFNTTLNQTRVYSGSAWQAPFTPTDSSQVVFQQSGAGAVALTVQGKAREGVISVTDFGADNTGVTPIDTALAAAVAAALTAGGGLKVYLPRGTYRLNATANVGVSLVGAGSDCVTINFYGTGWAINASNGRDYGGFKLVSQGNGQSGFLLRGGIGTRVRDIIANEFDTNGVQIGQAGAGGAGAYFCDIDYIQCTNNATTGTGVGFCIDGLASPNSNANIARNLFVKGRWKKLYSIKGNANILHGGDAEPNNSGTSGGITSVIEIGGIGNRWEALYLEPIGATPPPNLFSFPAGSRSNKVIGIYAPSAGNTPYARITDAGVGNEVDFAPTGFNFTQPVGVARSSTNLIPNADFANVDSSNAMPFGWNKSVTGTSTVARSTEQLRGAPYSLKFECAGDGRAVAGCFIATHIPGTRGVLRHIRRDKLVGKTVTCGVWCYSTTAGFGAIKISDGAAGYGYAQHSGGGAWEFLSIQASIKAGPTEMSVQLRSNADNLNSTGVCYFTEPILVFGTDVPQVPTPAPLTDGEAVMAGRFVGSPWQAFTSGDTTPSVLEGNFFKTANAGATTISDFDDEPVGRGAQIIYLRAGDANTTIANNANITTSTGANKLLTNGVIYKFVWDAPAAKWIEF